MPKGDGCVADLIETPPLAGQALPLTRGEAQLSALPPGPIHAIAPFPGQAAAVADLLGGFPRPGQVLSTPAGMLVWAGRETAFLFGPAPDLRGLAAVTDQSDGWAGLRLSGADAAAVLARLVPLDLDRLPAGSSARSLLNHQPLLLIHAEPGEYHLWSYRSMAATMVHEIETSMTRVAARRTLP
jgi:hypothetical protein